MTFSCFHFGLEFRMISRMHIAAFYITPNKLIDDDLTLNVLDISEASIIKTRKNQGLQLSYTQVNWSSWQINAKHVFKQNFLKLATEWQVIFAHTSIQIQTVDSWMQWYNRGKTILLFRILCIMVMHYFFH